MQTATKNASASFRRLFVILLLGMIMMVAGCRSDSAGSIAFLAVSDGYWEVWITEGDGSEPRRLSEFRADVSRISWFPDGRAMFVNLHDGRMFRLDVESDEATVIQAPMQGILDAVVSPDGKRAAFSLSTADSIDNNDIWMFDIATGALDKLTSMARLQHEPTWSRDGGHVYFLSGQGGQTHDIWRVDIKTRATEQLTVNALYHFDLAARSDDVLAYSGNKTGDYDLWLRYPDGKTEQLTQDAELDARPSWSADGKALAFESTREGSVDIWRYELESRAIKRMTQMPEGARHPVWAPVVGAAR